MKTCDTALIISTDWGSVFFARTSPKVKLDLGRNIVRTSFSFISRKKNTVPLCWVWGPGIAVLWSCQRVRLEMCDSIRLLFFFFFLHITGKKGVQLSKV